MNAHAQTSADPGRAHSLRLAVLLATYMQSANLPLPNAVLRLIQGTLSMTDDQAGWIFTAYLAASAITLPIAQWLAGRLGLKLVYQAALAVFVLGLLLATVATTPLQFIGARIIQGLASGVLAPLSMAIAMETLAPEKRMKFGATWTAIVLLGIVSGPSIGGWIAEHFDWRPIFYISLPLSAYIFLVVALLLAEKKPEKAPSFDFFGFGSFTLALIGLQMLLDRGERLDWFDSPEIWIEALACGVPVAGYPVPGPLDIIGAEGLGPFDELTEPVGYVSESLSFAITQALSCSRIAAARYGAQFTWDRAADQFLAALYAAREKALELA